MLSWTPFCHPYVAFLVVYWDFLRREMTKWIKIYSEFVNFFRQHSAQNSIPRRGRGGGWRGIAEEKDEALVAVVVSQQQTPTFREKKYEDFNQERNSRGLGIVLRPRNQTWFTGVECFSIFKLLFCICHTNWEGSLYTTTPYPFLSGGAAVHRLVRKIIKTFRK